MKTKNAAFVLHILLCCVLTANAQEIDAPSLDTMPKALPATKFVFPKYDEFVLDNGLHVFVIEDHSLPRVTFSLSIKSGDAYDPSGKEGVATIAADMMMKGTDKLSATEFAARLDGVGASLSASSAGEQTTISGAALKKHVQLLFTSLGEALTESTYGTEEIEKLKDQYIANIASQQSQSDDLAAGLSRKVIYGHSHPLARAQSKGSVGSITPEDVRAFHTSWHRPNIASIAVVGDITTSEVKKLLAKHLKNWTKASVPSVEIPAMATEKAGVYFIPRPGSVQSSIVVCAAAPSVTAEDWNAVDVTLGYIGSGFGSLLFSTLRETYSYTYSPFGYVTRGNRYNRIATGADVRTEVTDSAIAVILREIRGLGQNGPDPIRLEQRIAYEAGQYRLSYEKASNVASMLQLAWLCDKPVSWAAEWTDRIEEVGYSDVTTATQKYLDMFKLRIVVVGDPSVVSKLEQFGQVSQYDVDFKPITQEQYTPAGITVSELVAKYTEAIGGAVNVGAVQTVVMTGAASMTMQGQAIKGTVTRKLMSPNMEMSVLDLGVMKQQQWTDGNQAWVCMNGGEVTEADAEETARLTSEARIFPVLAWEKDGVTSTMLGKKGNVFVVKAELANGKSQRYVFDAKSYLLVQTEKDEVTPKGPITVIEKFSEYSESKGVRFPSKVRVETPIYSLDYTFGITVNSGVTAADFKPESK